MTTAFELPTDWFVENDGQGFVLDPEKVQAVFTAKQEIEDELRAELAIAECLATEANGGMTAMTFSQRAVEAAARAIYESRNGSGCKPWSLQTKAHKEPYLDDAKAALSAALAVDGVALMPVEPSEREINAAIAALGSDDDRSSAQIVMDVRAAMLSCKSDIFEQTYEAVQP